MAQGLDARDEAIAALVAIERERSGTQFGCASPPNERAFTSLQNS
jgi:hypothetical protein